MEKAQQKAREAGVAAMDVRAPRPEGLPSHQVPADAEGNPSPKAQRNITDPDTRIMTRGGEFLQGYHCQAVVDAESRVIVAMALWHERVR